MSAQLTRKEANNVRKESNHDPNVNKAIQLVSLGSYSGSGSGSGMFTGFFGSKKTKKNAAKEEHWLCALLGGK